MLPFFLIRCMRAKITTKPKISWSGSVGRSVLGEVAWPGRSEFGTDFPLPRPIIGPMTQKLVGICFLGRRIEWDHRKRAKTDEKRRI